MTGLLLSDSRQSQRRSRQRRLEAIVMGLLISAASIAILVTIGIVLSMVFETVHFFRIYDWTKFFFGSTWSPNFRGDSELAILPLLWGTLYISAVALLVAVPVGLFAAVYLAEFAGSKVRATAKPLLELLAGIPTIVYGLFALITVGPGLVRLFGEGGVFGVSWMAGASSVLTAGLVMGIMLIPFVSSLSDDIINAVPQSLRDGSLGLGATRSETIRQVVLPAALPGIVGAILLAASRAIGETMIVVMGAGAVAKISGNPFEAMTTITTRIVSQLTGDSDFTSPETLVAFALGISLFVLTLGLNIVALAVVRKYREQYE
jgi:phosphate transport system permease protein